MKYLIITKKQIISVLCAVLGVVLGIVGAVRILAVSEKSLPIYCVDRTDKKIAISFDAAWGNDDTETLIKILKEYDVPATFFVVGNWVDKYPESVKALHEAGHQVQNHSDTHPYFTKISVDKVKDEILSCNEKIESITGITPTLIRVPYGDYNSAVINTVNTLDMKAIQWNVDSLDWKETATAESIANRVISKVCPGSIILCHNDADHTPEALPTILKTLKDKGYEFVFISELIYDKNYEIDNTGKQIKIS
ncbi:MAG: polysaccharide deacetylase family protein [Clostridia bacterium]|nr:polysaccharide deacetylase family protein [Clostridia bacterium]